MNCGECHWLLRNKVHDDLYKCGKCGKYVKQPLTTNKDKEPQRYWKCVDDMENEIL